MLSGSSVYVVSAVLCRSVIPSGLSSLGRQSIPSSLQAYFNFSSLGRGKEIVEILGMDGIWMPVLEQRELIQRQRDGEEGQAQTAEQVGANKRHRI